jgi:hypothetical protein
VGGISEVLTITQTRAWPLLVSEQEAGLCHEEWASISSIFLAFYPLFLNLFQLGTQSFLPWLCSSTLWSNFYTFFSHLIEIWIFSQNITFGLGFSSFISLLSKTSVIASRVQLPFWDFLLLTDQGVHQEFSFQVDSSCPSYGSIKLDSTV